MGLARPEAEEDDESKVANSNDIVSNAPCTLETPRAPGQTAVVRLVHLRFVENGERGVGVV